MKYHNLPKIGEIGVMQFELFDWNAIINCGQASIDHRQSNIWNDAVKHLKPKNNLSAAVGRPVRMATTNTLDNDSTLYPSFAYHNAELIPQVAYVRKIIEDKHLISKTTNRVNCHLFFTLHSKSEGLEWHADDCDTYIWQIQGETLWKLQMGDTNTDPIEEFNLTPNDMIYIPKYWHHHPIGFHGPRCSVSFSIENNFFDSVEERSDI
jgi:mannose-6-phosphate isomerase-like protein (cupin superfamily)